MNNDTFVEFGFSLVSRNDYLITRGSGGFRLAMVVSHQAVDSQFRHGGQMQMVKGAAVNL
ncbi:MAG: hypothetical protein RLZZ214_249 [Verrucomicrobiota bacterium]